LQGFISHDMGPVFYSIIEMIFLLVTVAIPTVLSGVLASVVWFFSMFLDMAALTDPDLPLLSCTSLALCGWLLAYELYHRSSESVREGRCDGAGVSVST